MVITYAPSQTVTVTELRGYSTSKAYALKPETDSQNIRSWLDMGATYDNTNCKFQILVNKADIPKIETLIRARNEGNTIQISSLLDGFRPFGWNKDHSGTIDVTILSISAAKQRDIFAKVQSYSITMAPVNQLAGV